MKDCCKEWLNDNIDLLLEVITDYISVYKKEEIKQDFKKRGWLPMDALEEAREYYHNKMPITGHVGLDYYRKDYVGELKRLYEKAIEQLQNEIKELKKLNTFTVGISEK